MYSSTKEYKQITNDKLMDMVYAREIAKSNTRDQDHNSKPAPQNPNMDKQHSSL
jgi:hypothetical protein